MTKQDSLSAYDMHEVYSAMLDVLQTFARRGNKFAALEVIRTMTRENLDLASVGYRVKDDGGITVITQEWLDQQIAGESERDKLIRKFRETNDPKYLHEMIILEDK